MNFATLPIWARLGVFAFTTLAPMSSAMAHCPAPMAPVVWYGTGGHPSDLLVADLNGDGLLDVVVVELQGEVSCLLGAPGGTFQPAVGLTVPSGARGVAMADFNGDCRPDAAVAGAGGIVSILLGTGSGTFKPPVAVATGAGSADVAVGDVDADGDADLAVANATAQTVSVLLGDGAGSFQPGGALAGPGSPVAVALVDLNADGALDLVLANADGHNLTTRLGGANGTFQPPVSYDLGGRSPTSVEAGDVDLDGAMDVVVGIGDDLGNAIAVLRGAGDGILHAPVDFPVSGLKVTSVALGDFNTDGDLDVATSNELTDMVSILFGNGNGTFTPANLYPVGPGPTSVASGDFNLDGRLDIAVAIGGKGVLATLLNNSEADAAYPTVATPPPAIRVAEAGVTTSFTVVADGHGSPITYRWRRNGIELFDGGHVAGAASPTLNLIGVVPSDTGSYDVRITAPDCDGGTVSTLSSASVLAVTGSGCAADLDGSGSVDSADLGVLLAAWGLCD